MPQVQPASTILPLCRYPVMLQWWFIGTALACILHGAVLIVSFVCVYWLSRNGQRLSPVHRRILYFYVAFMTLLACGGVIWSIFSLFRVLFNAKGVRGSPLGPAGSVIHVFANWGADGFLLYRCFVLYKASTRVKLWLMKGLLWTLAVANIVAGTLFLSRTVPRAPGVTKGGLLGYMGPRNTFVWFSFTTLFVNTLIPALTVFRLNAFRKRAEKTLGRSHSKPYRNLIFMCTKSAVLICAFNVILLTFFYNVKDAGLLFLSLEPLGQIYVLSPLLVVYHIAQGKTWAVVTNPFMTQDIEEAINRQPDPHTVRLSQIPGSVISRPSVSREIPASDGKHL